MYIGGPMEELDTEAKVFAWQISRSHYLMQLSEVKDDKQRLNDLFDLRIKTLKKQIQDLDEQIEQLQNSSVGS